MARLRQAVARFVLRWWGPGAPAPAGPIRILVVDDELQVCEFASRVLSGAGYHVTTAADGPAAIAVVNRDGAPDLLLTDLKMPDMGGDELAARLRQSVRDLKVLYLTGFSQTLFNKRGVLCEGEAFLEKPCSPALLLEGVSLALFNRVAPTAPVLPRQVAAVGADWGSPKGPGNDGVV